jgi:VWFA-related protein
VKRLFAWCALFISETIVGQDATIRTTVPLVVLPTSVTDRHGAAMGGLSASDFLLTDGNRPRSVQLDVVDSGLVPIALVVLVQTSDTASPALAKIRRVGAMISQSVVGENGEVAILSFSDRVDLRQSFTRDANRISEAFEGLKASDGAGGRMLDAVAQALKILSERPASRRASILIIGESRDRGSETKLEALTPSIQNSAATIYGLRYSAYWTAFTTKPEDYRPSGGGLVTGIGELARLAKQNTMEALTHLTGGVQQSFETKSKLEKDLMEVSRDLHNRYLVSFAPGESAGSGFHPVSIRIRDHPEALVHTRPGYWVDAVSQPGTSSRD